MYTYLTVYTFNTNYMYIKYIYIYTHSKLPSSLKILAISNIDMRKLAFRSVRSWVNILSTQEVVDIQWVITLVVCM